MKIFLYPLLIWLLTGCLAPQMSTVNPFNKFYLDTTLPMTPAMRSLLLPASGPPQIETVARPQAGDACQRMMEHGFWQIGYSSFDGPPASREQLIEQAQRVGAEGVILTGEYVRTTEGQIPFLTFQPGQTYTTQERGSVTANTFGSGGSTYGYGTYSGSSTTTTPGTFQFQSRPYQIPVYSQGAIFWRRLKPGIFGAYCIPIPDDVRVKLERNTGMFVNVIVEGSPAFKANILRGDVIIKFADKPVDTTQDLMETVPAHAGQTVQVTLIRGGQMKVLEVQLNP